MSAMTRLELYKRVAKVWGFDVMDCDGWWYLHTDDWSHCGVLRLMFESQPALSKYLADLVGSEKDPERQANLCALSYESRGEINRHRDPINVDCKCNIASLAALLRQGGPSAPSVETPSKIESMITEAVTTAIADHVAKYHNPCPTCGQAVREK